MASISALRKLYKQRNRQELGGNADESLSYVDVLGGYGTPLGSAKAALTKYARLGVLTAKQAKKKEIDEKNLANELRVLEINAARGDPMALKTLKRLAKLGQHILIKPKKVKVNIKGSGYGDYGLSPPFYGYGGTITGGTTRQQQAAAHNPWLEFLREFRARHPETAHMRQSDVVREASAEYQAMKGRY